MSSERCILAGDLWPGFNDTESRNSYETFRRSARTPLSRLIESLILYDRIVIPTEAFVALPVLIEQLGEEGFLELLDSGVLKFVRFPEQLSYQGGTGLVTYAIHPREGKIELPSPYGPVDQAVRLALNVIGCKSPAISPAVIRATEESHIELKAISKSTFADISGSAELNCYFAKHGPSLRELAGYGSNNLRITDVYSSPNNPIERLLFIARANLELTIAAQNKCQDLSTAMPLGHILRSKESRSTDVDSRDRYLRLREIAELPDIGEAVLQKRASIRSVLNFRDSRNISQFREWFHKECKDDPTTVGREYAKLLREVPAVDSLPARITRFVVTTGIGLISGFDPVTTTAVATAVSAVDSFAVSNWFKGKSPKFFIEELRQFEEVD